MTYSVELAKNLRNGDIIAHNGHRFVVSWTDRSLGKMEESLNQEFGRNIIIHGIWGNNKSQNDDMTQGIFSQEEYPVVKITE